MSTRKRVKANKNLYTQIWKLSRAVSKGLTKWLLRSLLVISRRVRRRARLSRAGFVLPTVAMVTLVVVLLTTMLVIRSFDRSKNASIVRVNEAVLNAATPALDRARAKIDNLFAILPRETPSDSDLYNAIAENLKKYTFGDEKPLKLVFEIETPLTTAWRFPVDTDNNGKYDSYTLYGIYFRSPTRDNNTGQFNRPRNPLEARTPPMDDSAITGQCAGALGTSASLVGNSDWYKSGDQLKKSFYVYTATVPITNTNLPTGYETYKGNKGFSALEFQQDRARIPLSNNAVVYEDDLDLTSTDTGLRLNGRIVTNSNLLTGKSGNGAVALYQVSSKDSCYYKEESSKIVVGGNVAAGSVTSSADQDSVNVHLFNGAGNPPDQNQTISSTNKSTSNAPRELAYNSQAYAQRISRLVDAQVANPSSTDPKDVQNKVNAVPTSQQAQERRKQLEIYFRNRTRRVPFSEVPYGGDALGAYATSSPLQGSFDTDTLRPPDAWMYPNSPSDGITGTGYTGLSLKTDQLQATEPQKQKQNGTEKYLGDRIQVGNNLPAIWFKNGALVGGNTKQDILGGATWTEGSGTRYRQTRVQPLADVGITDRDGFWEQAAAAKPTTPLDNTGGLRVVTGAGVYERKNSFLPPLTTYDDPATATVEAYPMVWPDSMPMSPGSGSQVFNQATGQWTALPTLPLSLINSIPATPTIDPTTPKYAKGDLRMRATAVYHYAQSAYDPNTPTNYQTPIACVSSYYDPSDNVAARNPSPLPDVSGLVTGSQPTTGAKSNNGVVYGQPTTNASSLSGVSGSNATTGLFNGNENSTTLLDRLYYQANLKFPNGRFVNEPLRNALNKKASNQNLTLSEQSAIDSTICALQILNGTLTANTTFIPHGAIRENAFLDARQIKAIEQDVVDDPTTPAVNEGTNAVETFTTDGDAKLTGSYNLSIEERQPLEIRATVLDMNLLRKKMIAGSNVLASSEYLLPNSGIIYASRDDALLDLSDKSSPNIQTRKLLSPTDFKLDPTRRPNGILLTNGSNLSRPQSFSEAEKGLILATDLPVYVKSDFNLHSGEEFTNNLDDDWGDFYTRTVNQINNNFACRAGDPRLPNCTTGDQWRPATVLADAITLLSNNFQFGFRNDGDYDLRNNQGDQDSINKHKKNGFWNNNFVTSRNFQDSIYSGNTGTTNDDSSYFNNFVTPIQRRVNGFPEYIMEICRKLPVSECKPDDWVVGFDSNGDGSLNNTEQNIRATQLGAALVTTGKTDTNNNKQLENSEVGWSTPFGTGNKSPLERLGAGTTARAALVPADQRYPRRVAFARSKYKAISFQQIFNTSTTPPTPLGAAAKPLGVGCPLDTTGNTFGNNGCNYPGPSDTLTAGTHYGNTTNVVNALWFRTTTNKAGNPSADANYSTNLPLYYLPPDATSTKLILPDTLCFTNTNVVNCGTANPPPTGTVNLNLPVSDKASDYLYCLDSNTGSNAGNSKKYQVTTIGGTPQCNTAPRSVIDLVQSTLLGFSVTSGLPTWPTSGSSNVITAVDDVNVIQISGSTAVTMAPGTKIKLSAGTQSDPVFVLKANKTVTFDANTTNGGFQLELDGVNPNNIFWVFDSGSKPEFNGAPADKPHIVAGNFIGSSGQAKIGTNGGTGNIIIDGGRYLGFTTVPNIYGTFTFTAVTTDSQPLLVPVLQIQSTNGAPPKDPNAGGTAKVSSTRWMMPAAETKFNLVAATGDTPPRVYSTTSLFESNGGFNNFVRFLENWTNQTTAKISGSFIQLKRSAYATAPWSSVFSSNPGGIFSYRQAYRDDYGLLNSGWGYLPHYVAPNRQWGFDVALLSQSPDLFSQKFTLPPTSSPNEFFREVHQDDPWIKNLLCAAVGETPATGSGYTYTNPAVDYRQNLGCPQPLSKYQ